MRKSFCYFWLSPKVESPLPYRLQSTKQHNYPFCIFLCGFCGFVESNAESKIPTHRISHEVRKSFCYFWLIPKVESSLSPRLQSTKQRNFAESFAESAIPLPLISPDSFRKKGCTLPTLPPTTFKCVPKKPPLFAFRGSASQFPF